MSNNPPPDFSDNERLELAISTAEKMKRAIARAARSVSVFSGADTQQVIDQIHTALVEDLYVSYDPEKDASPTTYAFYLLRGIITGYIREARKQRRLTEYPDDETFAIEEEGPQETVEHIESLRQIPDRYIEEMNDAYDLGDRVAMVAAAKRLALFIIELGEGWG